jgi:hypothetical protein
MMEIDDLDRFENDIVSLAETLKQAFNADKVRWFNHEQTDTLYIEIGGLELIDDKDIERIATPIVEETDLDFEEIILIPHKG